MAEYESLSVNWAETELYEKQRIRKIRKNAALIALTMLIFFGLTAIPVIQVRYPAWRTFKAARIISEHLEQIKVDAISKKRPIRLDWNESGTEYKETWVKSCTDTTGEVRNTWSLPHAAESYVIVNKLRAQDLEISAIEDFFCFDPLSGFFGIPQQATAIIPVKDLTEKRLDRVSYVIVDALSAKISFH